MGKAASILGIGGGEEGLEENNERSKCFQRKNKKRTSEKMIGFDHLTAHHSTVLNNELNWRNTDWAKEASEIKSWLAKSQNNKYK